MSNNQTRLKLEIDLFTLTGQPAEALPDLKPPELVAAILEEFQETLPFLSHRPTDYHLLKADDRSALDDEKPLSRQLRHGKRLMLVENEVPPPPEAQPLSKAIYLREPQSGTVYKLHWQPAIIGRPDKKQAHHDWLAVNLERYEMGLRVSRGHAKITEKAGEFYIESLSAKNPTRLQKQVGATAAAETAADSSDETPAEAPAETGVEIETSIPVTTSKQRLENGDTIHLERSDISLTVIIRPDDEVEDGS